MSDLPGSKTQAVLTRMWLEQMVGCDCDNGKRSEPDPGQSGYSAWLEDDGTRQSWPCRRCVLVGVGGIRVRVDKPATDIVDDGAANPTWLLLLPAVEVADD